MCMHKFKYIICSLFLLIVARGAWGSCRVIEETGERSFSSVVLALSYASNHPYDPMTIILTSNDSLPSGHYTLPEMATLLIPYSDEQEMAVGAMVERIHPQGDAYTQPSCFRTLTFAPGVTLDVYGTLEVGATQSVQTGMIQGNVGPYYGRLIMPEGSTMILEAGSYLQAWGYITGESDPTPDHLKQGRIDARRGALVRELFQISDWTGGKNISGMLDQAEGVFPINQYYIQNIEVPVTYHPGAQLVCAAGVYIPTTMMIAVSNRINIIGLDGEMAMFLMNDEMDQEDTWVEKSYDPILDRQVYRINSGAHLGSLEIAISNYEMTSDRYILPITNNMSIHLLSGWMELTQSTVLLPGAVLEMDKRSTVIVNESLALSDHTVSEVALYVCGASEAGDPAHDGRFYLTNAYFSPVAYSPSWSACPRSSLPSDATVLVHGTLEVNGHLYTTADGAVLSTNADAGTIIFRSTTPAVDTTLAYVNGAVSSSPSNIITYGHRPVTSALLRNEGGLTPTQTTGAANDASYCYMVGRWQRWVQEDCFSVDYTSPDHVVYYAKPSEYVSLSSDEESEDHLYYSSDSSRIFVLDAIDCQWWEVELMGDGVVRCVHPQYERYLVYDNRMGSWVLKTVLVRWLDWDGSELDFYTVPYGTMPQYVGSNPFREPDEEYTYDFIGWSPVLSPVVANISYTAMYDAKPLYNPGPDIPTSLEHMESSDARKILQDHHLYIIRGGVVYGVDGCKVSR